MSFADAIIKLRSERRISQKELAEDLNVFVIREYCKRHGVVFAYDEEQKRGDAG